MSMLFCTGVFLRTPKTEFLFRPENMNGISDDFPLRMLDEVPLIIAKDNCFCHHKPHTKVAKNNHFWIKDSPVLAMIDIQSILKCKSPNLFHSCLIFESMLA
ncbi:hypothetical protein BpHYR1_021690 [Brachionus plicatilis]|uniref:Uncharacterized protein n=1 Tax=Brachionus plicatilis TaxID=10195 RepID=A0A3M7QGB1_BRAPC|nr:hypothetical protein BpHYR1_021690 [Brachionus plicatilis]